MKRDNKIKKLLMMVGAARFLLSEDGALSEDGECRLGPWGYVVQPLFHRQLP